MPSNVYIDTEFHEYPSTIELISIALVSEDGRELYLENSEADLSKADEWLKKNVIAHLQGGNVSKTRTEIRKEILEFIGDTRPEFWAYFADYDWVVFCWIFGRMIDLPSHFPKYCRDLKQLMDTYSIKKSDLPKQTDTNHHALADARWVRDAYWAAENIIRNSHKMKR